MQYLSLIFVGFISLFLSIHDTSGPFPYKENLSEYGFFTGNLNQLKAAKGIVPYDLQVPLFSDHAFKSRFLYLPMGSNVAYNADSVLQFPVGAILIKTFYYPLDFRKPEGKRRIIETRLMLHESVGWVGLPYIWNEEQTEATLDVAGGDQEITWKDENGKEQHLKYLIPNFNQCKGCHLRNQKVEPIGPSARQLNGILKYPNGQKSNQLEYWEKEGIVTNLPKDRSSIPAYPAWENGEINDIDAKAIAYLDINCSHCHNPAGPAASSGLYFSQGLKDPKHLGVFKTPVAAGRGSGGFLYDIVPGKPEQSILIYRMKSRDPGIMMPELSRQLLDQKGIDLVTQWIEQMK